MSDIYEIIPILDNENLILRAIDPDKDLQDLFEVYSDVKAVSFFNSDNCHGDTFYYKTKERMRQAIDFWNLEYHKKYYVRMAIEDKLTNKVIGTIELFNRKSEDYFNNCGLLRLDLRSDHETYNCILDILDIIVPKTKELFQCDMIATKAITEANDRISALREYGFRLSNQSLIGFDGTKYGSYYVMELY